MTRASFGSMRSALWYSRMASLYWALPKYWSPRARWRAFLASGDRAHPPAARSPITTSRTINLIDALGTMGHLSTRSVRQIIIQNGVYRPDVPGEALGSLLDASVDRAHDPDERAIGAVVGERAPDHRDP